MPPPSRPGSGSMIIIVVVFLLLSLAAVLGVYFSKVTCPTFGSDCPAPSPAPAPAQAPAPAPAALDPRATVWAMGQKLQGDPLEIGTAVVPLSPQPTLPATVKYSMSMDLNIANQHSKWRNILSSNNGVHDWDNANNHVMPNTRRPLISLTGDDYPPANRVVFHHADAAIPPIVPGIISGGGDFTLGQWFNLTIIVDSKIQTMYINGINKGTITSTVDPVWPSPTTTWSWNNTTFNTWGVNGSVKVANAYFFPSVLTEAQVVSLKVPTAASPGVATTSYYTAEPTRGGIEGYSPY